MTLPPAFKLDELTFTACHDFFTVNNGGGKVSLPSLSGSPEWHKDKRGGTDWLLTVHDPTQVDIVTVSEALRNPMLMKLELAVDLRPHSHISGPARENLLVQSFAAAAGRFRPKDMALWGYGTRGGLRGVGEKPAPFHQRFAHPDEELIYGHRGEWLQSKLYLKRMDQGKPLSTGQHRVRMELTMKRWACLEFGLDRLDDLLDFSYRSVFTKHFRIVDHPRIRELRNLTPNEREKRERRMLRAWKTAGVGKFAISKDAPADTSPTARAAMSARAKNQLPVEHFVLKRDQKTNEKIGLAFRQLQRRMMK